jgi:NADP-dependent 3-hydroxy acid dehydrogenase YdfG
MLKRENKSGIINLSSFGGTQAIPFISVYSATKVTKKRNIIYKRHLTIIFQGPSLRNMKEN